MKVMAKHWLNYNGVWHKAGEVFEVENFEEVKDSTELMNDFPQVTLKEPARRGRQKKTED